MHKTHNKRIYLGLITALPNFLKTIYFSIPSKIPELRKESKWCKFPKGAKSPKIPIWGSSYFRKFRNFSSNESIPSLLRSKTSHVSQSENWSEWYELMADSTDAGVDCRSDSLPVCHSFLPLAMPLNEEGLI